MDDLEVAMDLTESLVTENEALHALLADASMVLFHFAEAHGSELAASCLQRIADAKPSPDATLPRPLVRELVASYASWLEESAVLERTYRQWMQCDGGDRALAFEAYAEALDREERAARAHRRMVELSVRPRP
jgi:hypothetical protein